MTPERWQRVAALFERARAEPPDRREGVVRASSEPPDVRDEVLSLLRADLASAGFLDPSAGSGSPRPFDWLRVVPSEVEGRAESRGEYEDEIQPGATIGRYRIESLLGRGGMGVVYLASDTRLHRRVALKALRPAIVLDERHQARLRQEARAAAALSHPAITTVYALEEIDGRVFIASEYVEGPTLRTVLTGGPLPARDALAIGRDVVGALVAAHGRGIVHRDLKPENIVRTSSGAVKILDFGLAQFDHRAADLLSTLAGHDGTLAGTPLYMAPEQLLGQPTSFRTDLFAFGVLVYELMTGRHPFGEGPLPSIIARVLTAAPQPDGRLPERVWRVLQICLARDPADRFGSTMALADALSAVEGDRQSTRGTSTPGTIGTTGTTGTLGASRNLWWWQFHQLAATIAYAAMVWPAWHVRAWTGRAGVLTFLGVVATVIVAGSLRLHLWFASRTYSTELAAERARVELAVRATDVAFAAIAVASGLAIAGEHTAWGALFVAVGLAAALAGLVIEPTTARAAFGNTDGHG